MPTRLLSRLRPILRPAGQPAKRALFRLTRLRLQWIYLRDDIAGVGAALRTMRADHAKVLRAFGARVHSGASIPGPLTVVNAKRDYSNLSIGDRTHIGAEVFFDLADKITIEDGVTMVMRVTVITHFDVGRSTMAERRPRRTGPVRVCKDAFIGAGTIILHGVTIGEGALVGAGVVVSEDVPAGAILTRDGLRMPKERPS